MDVMKHWRLRDECIISSRSGVIFFAPQAADIHLGSEGIKLGICNPRKKERTKERTLSRTVSPYQVRGTACGPSSHRCELACIFGLSSPNNQYSVTDPGKRRTTGTFYSPECRPKDNRQGLGTAPSRILQLLRLHNTKNVNPELVFLRL